MKRLITAAAAAVLLISPVVMSAQEHMLEVKRYPDYAKDYLTITDAGLYFYTYDGVRRMRSYKIDFDKTVKNGDYALMPGLVITEINGLSTKGMSEAEFYSILQKSSDSISVSLQGKGDSVLHQKVYFLTSWPEDLSKCGITLLQINNLKKNPSPSGMSQLADREAEYKRINAYCTEMVDSDYDWFYANTYDFAISGNDPLRDKTLLEQFAEYCLDMVRDTENPDVLLTVAKDKDESIQITYVPPSSRTVNLGATTTARYNFITRRNDYVTTQNNYTVREGGYTNTTRNANLFLEISILDARKVNDTLQTVPPIIYQITTSRHVVNPDFNLDDELKAYATWGIKSDPYWNKYTEVKKTAFYPTVDFSELEVASVSDTEDGTEGLLPNDRIVRYKYSKKGKWIEGSVPEISNTKCTVLYRCVVERDGKTVRLDNVRLNERFGDIKFTFLK